MPLFAYRCQECGAEFEELVYGSADAEVAVRCPSCKSAKTEKQWAPFGTLRKTSAAKDAAPFCGRCGENRPPCGS
jgi:putative FmdB family regulatory protein